MEVIDGAHLDNRILFDRGRDKTLGLSIQVISSFLLN